jgi:hypothetical protein
MHLFRKAGAVLLAASLIPCAVFAQPPRAEPMTGGTLNDTARFLAGLTPSGGPAAQLAQTAEWQQHAAFMDAEWAKFDRGRLAKAREWSQGELDVRGAVFYPFSGPDFVYVYNFFPKAGTYILAALEPLGALPEPRQIPLGALRGIQSSLHTLLSAGYFVTKDMRANLRGTLPILCIMLARSGCTIHDIKPLGNGAQIEFTGGFGGRRTLFYISCDLSNGGFRGNRALRNLVAEAGARTAFVKAASYLLHTNDFSGIREMLLNNMRVIVQDDSGIPLRYFDPARWTVRLYGTYTPPLDIFKEHYQPDLAEAYRSLRAQRPIEFGLGYKWNPREATVIVASHK